MKKNFGQNGKDYMGVNSKFSWGNPKEMDNKGLRVAAVSPNTGMIQHIWPNVISAAKALTDTNQIYYAQQIGKALNNYHMKVLNYY